MIEEVVTDEKKPSLPKFGTAKLSPGGPLPRVIDPLFRANLKAGERRFKIRGPEVQFETKYVMAANAEDAIKCYIGDFQPVKGMPKLTKDVLSITELED